MSLSLSPCQFLYLDGDHSAQFLDPIQKDISLLDHRLVLGILLIGLVGLDNSPNFVDLSVQSTGSDESGQFPGKQRKC